MILDELIKSENTYGLFENWDSYRHELTEYILDSIESYRIGEYLKATKKIRMDNCYSRRDILLQEGRKILAIWGAGNSGDINLKELSRYFKLVLIDRDLDSLERARERYDLKAEECILVDIGFWNVAIEDYQLFEAMLIDGVRGTDIGRFLQHISDNMVSLEYENLPKFDYSVAIGVASQLNSRFMAMLKLYQEKNCLYNQAEIAFISNKLDELNKKAVSKMFDAIRYMTKEIMIMGYEVATYSGDDCISMQEHIDRLKQGIMEDIYESDDNLFDNEIRIAGSKELHNILNQFVYRKVIGEISKDYMKWNFLKDKFYVMAIRAFLELEIEV